MGKNNYKIFATILGVLGILCIVCFFVLNVLNKPVYNIVFDTMGGSVIASLTVEEGEKIEIPSNPIKSGYNFKEWDYNNIPYDFNLGVKNDMTLTAIWEKIIVEPTKYTVTFKLNEVTKTVTVASFSEINFEDLGFEEKKDNVIFWYLDGKEYDEDKPLKSNLILEGKYLKIENFTIKFNSDGGTKVKDQVIKTGGKVEEPKDVLKDGYVLDGWYINSAKYDFNNKVSKSFTLTAKWIEDTNIKWYNVTFDSDGGNEFKSQRIRENNTAINPGTPKKKNFIFVDWYNKDKPFDFKTKITSDIELKAVWKEPEKYQVIFQYDDGKEYMKRDVLEGEMVAQPPKPEKKDNEFVGWLLNGKPFTFETKIKNNIVLTAKFEPKNNNCTVTFNTGVGATKIEPITVECGNTITRPANPIKIGYKFIVWQLNKVEFIFTSKITSNITLDAIFEEKNCTVTFDSDGGTAVSPKHILYGDKIDNPPTTSKDNCQFVKWNLSNGGNFSFANPITDDISLKAEWNCN